MPGSTDERRALELLKNHAQFKATLVSLTMNGDLPILESHVYAVARKWFELARLFLVHGFPTEAEYRTNVAGRWKAV